MKKTYVLRIGAALLCACLLIPVFAGCDNGTPAVTNASTDAETATAAVTDTEEVTETEAVTDEETEETTEEVTEEETEAAVTNELGLTIVDDVVLIGSREELFAFAESVLEFTADYEDMTIKLTADIDLDPTLEGGKNWTPLPTEALTYATIDGDGHIINGMTIEHENLQVDGVDGTLYGSGFLGICSSSINIKNIVFTNALIVSRTKHCGCVIGSIEGSGTDVVIENVTISGLTINGGVGKEGDMTGISIRVGCVVGSNIVPGCTVEIKNCKVEDSTVYGFHNIGGIMGCVLSGQLTLENCSVENIKLNYSAGFAGTVNYVKAGVIRYFADPFYNVTDYWGEYHTDVDLSHGNTYKNVDSFDIWNNIHYTDEEGKTGDYPEAKYPVGGGTIRPKAERPD